MPCSTYTLCKSYFTWYITVSDFNFLSNSLAKTSSNPCVDSNMDPCIFFISLSSVCDDMEKIEDVSHQSSKWPEPTVLIKG